MIVLVVGMHRSGTSALAGMLHNNGIIMGKEGGFYPPPMRENPKGFYENKAFRVLNDQILKDHGYKVKRFDPDVPTMHMQCIRPDIRERMELLIAEYNMYQHWGFKDPRTCLTLPVWLTMMAAMGIPQDELRVLIPCRATDDIVASMRARGNKEREPGQFRRLVIAYNQQVIAGCNGRVDFMTVDFTRLMNDTQAVTAELAAFTGCPITDTSFIEPGIAENRRAQRG